MSGIVEIGKEVLEKQGKTIFLTNFTLFRTSGYAPLEASRGTWRGGSRI